MIHQQSDRESYYVLPGGGIESGETAEGACLRELEEETTIAGEIIRHIATLDNRDRAEHYSLVRGDGTAKLSMSQAHGNTGSSSHRLVWMPVHEVEGMAVRPKAIMGLLAEEQHW